MAEFHEVAYNFIQGDTFGTFYVGTQKWINKVKRWKEQYPEEVEIKHVNQEDGSMVVKLPVSWLKVSPPRKMSAEQAQAARDRMVQYHRSKSVT